MKARLIVITLLAAAFLFAGCLQKEGADSEKISPDERQAIISVLQANIKAAENENLNGFMQTIHPDSPAFESTRSFMKKAFAEYDFNYEIVEANVLEVSGDVARVSYIQITRKKSGPDAISDNQVRGEHILKKADGRWKIYSTNAQQYTDLQS